AAETRAVFDASQIDALVPERGSFIFPAPYGTEAVRLTGPSDSGGKDCSNAVGYSYWSNTNNHAGSDTMLIFVGMDRLQGGKGPSLIEYDKRNGEVRNLGPLFDEDDPL